MVPLSRGRPRSHTFAVPRSSSALFVSAHVFKLISFGLIACFVEVLVAQGHHIVVAVSAAVAITTCSGIGRDLARRRHGHLLI